MSPGHGSPVSGPRPASPPSPGSVQPSAVVAWMIGPPSGPWQWSSSGPRTGPPVAPAQGPGLSSGETSPSGATYSVVSGAKEPLLLPLPPLPLLLLLLHAKTNA